LYVIDKFLAWTLQETASIHYSGWL